MNKELDSFILQTVQSIFRYNTHKDLQMMLNEINELYNGIQHIRDTKNIFIGPLHIQSPYAFPVTSSFLSIADEINSNKASIYTNPLYSADCISESFRVVTCRDSIGILLCLGFLLGPRVFAHEGLVYRLRHIGNTGMIQVNDYGEPMFGVNIFGITKYVVPIFGRVFELLNLVPVTETRYHYMYGVADIFVKICECIELPIKIPLDLAWYPSVKKTYLRYIMHHPEDARYLDAFESIKADCRHSLSRALYYFAHTVGGVYAPPPGKYPTSLSKWYNKEINEKQLDEIFDDMIREELGVFEELVQLGIGISLDANLRLTKKRFTKMRKLIESPYITEYGELAGPFLIKDSSMLSIKILRRQIND